MNSFGCWSAVFGGGCAWGWRLVLLAWQCLCWYPCTFASDCIALRIRPSVCAQVASALPRLLFGNRGRTLRQPHRHRSRYRTNVLTSNPSSTVQRLLSLAGSWKWVVHLQTVRHPWPLTHTHIYTQKQAREKTQGLVSSPNPLSSLTLQSPNLRNFNNQKWIKYHPIGFLSGPLHPPKKIKKSRRTGAPESQTLGEPVFSTPDCTICKWTVLIYSRHIWRLIKCLIDKKLIQLGIKGSISISIHPGPFLRWNFLHLSSFLVRNLESHL